MKIQLENICPRPLLKGDKIPSSQIWGQKVSFEKGKNYLVRAPSGKGKSTFLHVLYGLRKDFQGQLLIDDQDTAKYSSADWLQKRREDLSMVFQDLRLFPQLTSLENLQVKSELSSFKSEAQINEMAKALGISDLLQQKAASLSYGQQQRVAIVRALCQPFSFLLLDEPFSHLDEANIEVAAKLIAQEVSQQEASLILVSLETADVFSFSESKRL